MQIEFNVSQVMNNVNPLQERAIFGMLPCIEESVYYVIHINI